MEAERKRALGRAALTVAALGVVFGDIGTSPIYTIQTAFNPGDPASDRSLARQRLRDRLADLLVGDDRSSRSSTSAW